LTVQQLIDISDTIKSLEEFDVSWVQEFDDAVMDHLLKKHTAMSKLVVRGCNRLTEVTVKLWQRDLPSLRITGFMSSSR
jgi:hypothetical protein